MGELVAASRAELIVGAATSGRVLVLVEPLSFWGGVEPASGRIIDRHHRQVGVDLRDTVLVVGASRGSSSSTSTLLECVRLGTAPRAFILTVRDPFIVVAAAAAREIYDRGPTVILIREANPESAALGEAVAASSEFCDGSIVNIGSDASVRTPE